MKKYDSLYSNINNLLTYLRDCKVVEKVDDYYLGIFNNRAPGRLIQMEMNELQEKLDKAKD